MVKAKKEEAKEEAASTKKSSGTKEETYKVRGEKLLEKVKELVKEGNVRRIIIKDKKGKTMVEFPMTFGVVGVLIAPTLAAIGALAALITECSITVEREV
jgi:hypothetical protein